MSCVEFGGRDNPFEATTAGTWKELQVRIGQGLVGLYFEITREPLPNHLQMLADRLAKVLEGRDGSLEVSAHAVMEQQADQPLECKNGWTLADLGPGQCRFIIGHERSPTIFCGDPVVPGTSWCVKHRKRVFAHPAGLPTAHKAEKRLSGRP